MALPKIKHQAMRLITIEMKRNHRLREIEKVIQRKISEKQLKLAEGRYINIS